MKQCTQCHRRKPATAKFFGHHPQGRGGLRPDCKTCVNRHSKAWHATHKAHVRRYLKRTAVRQRAYARASYWRHRETRQASVRKRYWKERTLLLKQQARYRSTHRAYFRRYFRAHYQRHRELYIQRARARQSHLRLIGHYTSADIQRLRLRQLGKCAYCPRGLGTRFHIDHIIPISRGGLNWSKNLVLACAKCNLCKRNKTGTEFRRWLKAA